MPFKFVRKLPSMSASIQSKQTNPKKKKEKQMKLIHVEIDPSHSIIEKNNNNKSQIRMHSIDGESDGN